MNTKERENEIMIYIRIELSLINDKIRYYQNDMNLNKKEKEYFQLMENLNNQKEIVSRILKISENLMKE